MEQGQARAFVDPFVLRNWRVLAAAAWKGHGQQGRGALVVEWHTVRQWVDGQATVIATRYVTTCAGSEVTELVAQYDPAHSIVIVFVAESDGGSEASAPARSGTGAALDTPIGAWVFTHAPPPPQAFFELQRND